jgi:protein O-mannosyl-transferase
MSKQKKDRTIEIAAKQTSSKNYNLIFIVIIIAFTFGIYGNTVRNYYNLDDYHVAKSNPDFERGIKSIPKIFTTLYATEGELSYGYRPLIRTSFVIEYQFFGKNPYISHFINIVFFLIAVLLLYKILRRLLRDYHQFLPFIITLIFIAHPIHTEIVASLKNRDELFMIIFALLSLDQALKYADSGKNKHIYLTLGLFLLSVLSKSTAAAFLLIIPLSLYFFTDLELKKNLRFTAMIIVTGIVAALGPMLYLPSFARPMSLTENPLAVHGGIMNHIAYAGFTLMFYLKLLIVPHPLRYYYGYNMFPDISLGNPWVIAGILLHLGLLAFAIWKIKEKHILSYIILSYLISIFLFSNLVKPSPGIVAERFLLVSSIGFCFALGYFLYRLFWHNPNNKQVSRAKLAGILAVTIIILIPLSAKTIIRNQEWRTEYTLYKADMPYLYNSVKANDLYANEIMKGVNKELAKPVNVLKFVEPQVKEAIRRWKRAVEIQPDFSSAYRNLGIVYSRVYKNQDTAIYYFNKALEYEKDNPMSYFNLGMAYEGKENFASAIEFYQKSLALDSLAINTRSRMANVYYGMGEFRKAVDLNYEIMRIDPQEALPYVNLGNYYVFQKDTVGGIRFYEKAVELGAPPDASVFLSRYYERKGNVAKMNYYRKIADDLRRNQ